MLARLLALAFLVAVLMPWQASAGVQGAVTGGIRTSNYTGFLVAADAVTGHTPNRSLISGFWTMDFAWDGLNTDGAIFESRIWLEDETGATVSIIPNGGGPAVTEIVESYQVSLDAQNTSDQHAFQASFRPVEQLQGQKRYTLRAKWRRQPAGGSFGAFNNVVLHASAASTTEYVHFTNTTANDGDLNISASARITSWDRRWLIADSPTQSAMRCNVRILAYRFDAYHVAPTSGTTFVTLGFALRNAQGATVWTRNNYIANLTVPSHEGGLNAAAEPTFREETVALNLDVPAGVLVPGQEYTPILTVTHTGDPGGGGADGTGAFEPQPLLRLSGRLLFGSFVTTFDELTNDPSATLDGGALPLPTTLLGVAAGRGFIPGVSGATYGNVAMNVRLEADGDALYAEAGTVTVAGVPGSAVVVNGVSLERSGVTLGSAGAQGGVTVRLPRGLSLSSTPGTRLLKNKFTQTNVPLAAGLTPTGVLGIANVYVALERLPLVFHAPGLAFSTTTGRFGFTPSAVAYDNFLELTKLEQLGANGDIQWPNGLPLHAGNEQFFRYAAVDGSTFQVGAGSDGAAFIHALRLGFNTGVWFAHFPRMWRLDMTEAAASTGVFEIANDVVTPASELRGIDLVTGFYDPNPKVAACVNPPATSGLFALMQPDSGTLRFLSDGSLLGAGQLATTGIPWGTASTQPSLQFAHGVLTTGAAVRAKVMLPGPFLPWREAALGGLGGDRAAALHLTGRSFHPTAGETVEAPKQPAYADGLADYAGYNIRKSENATLGGAARIEGTPLVYALLPQAKLNVRSGGVSGTVQSDTPLGPLSANGFNLRFDGMKLAFLDTEAVGSLLNGGVTLPFPSDFTFDFRGLLLAGNGALKGGEIAPEQGLKRLSYWRTEVTIRSFSFVQPEACAAPGSTPPMLALGVSTFLPAFSEQELSGVLGLRGNGTLVARGDSDNNFAVTGLDSRLRVPGNVKLRGPGSSNFTFTPASGAYLNAWPGNGGQPEVGYANLSGAIDLPFFESMSAHLHAAAGSTPATSPSVFVMAPPADMSSFELAQADPTNHGTPPLDQPGSFLGAAQYRSFGQYFARARKSWLGGLIDFDYPLRWDAGLRTFRTESGFESETDLRVASVVSSVRSLTPSTADLKFRALIGPQLPSIDANKLLGEAVDGVVGGALSAVQSAAPGFRSALDALRTFEQCLADVPDHLARGPIVAAIAHVRSQTPNPATLSVEDFRNALAARLNSVFSQPVTNGTSWKSEVALRLDQVQGLANSLQSVLSSGSGMLNLIGAIAPLTDPPGATASELPPAVQESFDRASSLLGEVRSRLTQIRTGVNAIALQPNWNNILTLASTELPANPLAGLTDAEVAEFILPRFLGDLSAGALAQEMRVHLSDTRDQVRSAFDGILAGVNEVLQAGSKALTPPIPLNGDSLGDLNFGRIDGQARINGDTLKELRLDVDFSASRGPGLDLKAWVLFRSITSDLPGSACRLASGVQAELVLGATTKFDFGAPPSEVTVEAEAKFAFGDGFFPTGLAGRIGLTGQGFRLGILTITQAELGLGFGGGDAYFYGKGAGRSDYADLEAAVYFGRACDLTSVMKRVDPQASELLQKPQLSEFIYGSTEPLYGFYVFGFGMVSVNSLIGIPPSPMLNLKAGAGLGGFFFGRPEGNAFRTVLGLRMDLAISGEVLALADVSARLSLIGATSPISLGLEQNPVDALANAGVSGNGSVALALTIGISPFDVTLKKTLRMDFSYEPLAFSLDL